MDIENPSELKDRIEEVTRRKIYSPISVTDDTSNYMQITSGTVLRLEGNDYFVSGEATEGRFGISDQPKYWVKYAWDLEDGSRKIIKLVFYESFSTTMGFFTFRLNRNPDKESAVLRLVEGDERFMQGKTVRDVKGNNVRIIDFVQGKSLYNVLAALEIDHERYFQEMLPDVLDRLAGSLDALEFLHRNGFQHGDVRNDHIFIEKDTGRFRWIDFDYEVNYGDYDVWSVGNVLSYVVGKGSHTCRDVESDCGEALDPIGPRDALLFFKHRLANLQKLFPYIPDDLNDMLMRFSAGTVDFYEDIHSIAVDLRAVIDGLRRG